MAKGVSIQVSGLKELMQKFGKLPQNIVTEIDTEMQAAAIDWEARAATDAPVDFGFLRNSISQFKRGTMHYEIVSGALYSAYVEFGTITKVQVPSDLVQYAALFKGRGIKKNGGMHARPFFFKQRIPVMAELLKNIQPAIDKAMKK